MHRSGPFPPSAAEERIPLQGNGALPPSMMVEGSEPSATNVELLATASTPVAMASTLVAMASSLHPL